MSICRSDGESRTGPSLPFAVRSIFGVAGVYAKRVTTPVALLDPRDREYNEPSPGTCISTRGAIPDAKSLTVPYGRRTLMHPSQRTPKKHAPQHENGNCGFNGNETRRMRSRTRPNARTRTGDFGSADPKSLLQSQASIVRACDFQIDLFPRILANVIDVQRRGQVERRQLCRRESLRNRRSGRGISEQEKRSKREQAGRHIRIDRHWAPLRFGGRYYRMPQGTSVRFRSQTNVSAQVIG
jgi:hypothetical protein